MKNFKGNSTAILAGAGSGAVLMALAVTMVFGLKTGIAGAVLVLLTVAVSVFSGWLIGLNQHIRKRNWYSYLRGYREGAAKKTLIIRYPTHQYTLTLPDKK